MITYEDFSQLDIRIGTIVSAEKVPEADKLLKLIVDIGDEKRQLMAGIAEFVEDIDSLVGKQIPILANLAYRKMRGYESQGMMLAADDGGPILLHPEKKVKDGSVVR
jgi:methionine--tRNA ligase beta chain